MGQISSCLRSEEGDPLVGTLPVEAALRPLMEQNYARIKEQCLKNRRLFEDPLFPATTKSLYYHLTPRLPKKWMRPKEITALIGLQPEFIIQGGSASDLVQGELGNCWVVAAAASLADHPPLLDRVAPVDQTFSSTDYAGIFKFNFYVYGQWIVVDDRLPTDDGRMIYVHSAQQNEFWGALLEKAYAKLYGCYQALNGGVCADALNNFTGGVTETYRLKDHTPRNIDRLLMQGVESRSLICTGIWGSRNQEMENGLVTGHAFSVADVEQVEVMTENGRRPIVVLKVRNPWGNSIEWRGLWSDRSPVWGYVSEKTRARLRHKVKDDGEFWMDLNDFVTNFDQVDICHMTTDSANNGTLRKWPATAVQGAWVKNQTAGGRLKYYESFSINPQYEFLIGEPNTRRDNHPICIIVELVQKRRRSRIAYTPLHVGFVLYQLHDDHIPPMPALFFQEQPRVGAVDSYIDACTVTKRFTLLPGRYIIIPSAWEPNDEGSFMLRVWSRDAVQTPCAGTPASEGVSYNYPTWSIKKNKIRQQNKQNGFHINDTGKNESNGQNGHTEPLVDKTRFIANGGVGSIPRENQQKGVDTQLSQEQNRSAYKLFKSYAGKDMTMNAEQLNRGLNSSYSKSRSYRFALDCCRSLISVVDQENRFRIYTDEFMYLYDYLELWTEKFRLHDKRNFGSVDEIQFEDLLYDLQLLPLRNVASEPSRLPKDGPTPKENINGHNKSGLSTLVQRFGDNARRVSYTNFINCCCKLTIANRLFGKYAKKSTDGSMLTLPAEQLLMTLLKF